MASLTVNPITASPTKAWQLSSSTPNDAVSAFKKVAPLGFECDLHVEYEGTPATPVFEYTIISTNPNQVPENGWVVSDGISVQIYTNIQFTQLFTSNVPLVWAPTTTAPIATPQTGTKATISFPQPTSPNGNWTYSVSQTDTTSSVTGAASAGVPVIDQNGNVAITVSNLTVGHVYTFAVTVNTQYAGVNATALASNAITAIV